MRFGDWLLQKMKEARIDRAEFVRRVGAGSPAVTKWITDDRVPSARNVLDIAGALGVSPTDVLYAALEPHRLKQVAPVPVSLPPLLTEAEAELVSELAWGVRRVSDRRRERRRQRGDEEGSENQ